MASLFRSVRHHVPSALANWLGLRRREMVRLATGVDIQATANRTAAVRDEVLADLEQRTLDLLARQDAVLASYDRRVAALVNRVLDLEERLGGRADDDLGAALGRHSARSPMLAAEVRAAVEPDPEEQKLLEDRLEQHVGLLREHVPVLDVGGRGVALAVLHAAEVAATGIGLDPVAAEVLRKAGLDAQGGDPMVDLVRRREASAGAVTLVGVVEGLELDDIGRVLRGVRRVLRPGGLLVVEATYPMSAESLARFWRDPTRRRPWDASAMEWLARHAGLDVVEVRAHPGTDADYALVARRP